jgi:hypothetical protein
MGQFWPPGGIDQLIYQENALSRAVEGTLSLLLLR